MATETTEHTEREFSHEIHERVFTSVLPDGAQRSTAVIPDKRRPAPRRSGIQAKRQGTVANVDVDSGFRVSLRSPGMT